MPNILNSEAFWLFLGAVSVYLSNSVVSRAVGKLPPTSPWRRFIRWAHGLLNRIDPGGNEPPPAGTVGMLVVLVVLASSLWIGACTAQQRRAALERGLEAGVALCASKLVDDPIVQTEARELGIDAVTHAERICRVVHLVTRAQRCLDEGVGCEP